MAVEALQFHLIAQKEYRLKMSPKYKDHDLVCTNKFGSIVDPKNFSNRHYRPLIREASVPYVKFHKLRHTHLTLFMAGNVHPKIAQAQAGHSSITITMDIYSHVTPEMQRVTANIMDDIIGR